MRYYRTYYKDKEEETDQSTKVHRDEYERNIPMNLLIENCTNKSLEKQIRITGKTPEGLYLSTLRPRLIIWQ